MLEYLSLDIICSSMLTVFLELRSRKAVRFSEQIMSADKYPCIFSREMETIVYVTDIEECFLAIFYPFTLSSTVVGKMLNIAIRSSRCQVRENMSMGKHICNNQLKIQFAFPKLSSSEWSSVFRNFLKRGQPLELYSKFTVF